jgi:ABC-2 type transport system ATP-binding protein
LSVEVEEVAEPVVAPGPPPEPVVVVEHLARSFEQRVVLRDVSFAVYPGDALGITGSNGSGKTALLRLMASLDRPTGGRVLVHHLNTVTQAGAVRRRIGYVPEGTQLYEGITAQQFLTFIGRAHGLKPQVRAATVSTLLQVVGLEDYRDRDLGAFSPGERRRLLLAAALLHEPDVLLLDDPLRGLDGQARLEQIEVLRELRRIGTTMVVTATRPDDVLDVCSTVAVLRDGVITWIGPVEATSQLADPTAAGAMRVRVVVLSGMDAALTLLSQRRDVRELELDEDGQTLWFLLAGDQEMLAGLLPQLVRAGCNVAHFGLERRSAAAAVANLFTAPLPADTITPTSRGAV